MANSKRGEIFKWRLWEKYATFCHDVREWFVRLVYVVIDGYLVFYPAALKGSGVLSYPERAGGRADGRAGGRADKPR